jgi:hypothetical protein
VIYGCIVAFHRYMLKSPTYSLQELADNLQLVHDLIGKIGGEMSQVVRCQKIIRLLLQPASALITLMQSASSPRYPPMAERGTGGSGEELHAMFQDPFFGSLNGLDGNEGFADLSAFSEELSALFPGGL